MDLSLKEKENKKRAGLLLQLENAPVHRVLTSILYRAGNSFLIL